MKSTDTRKNIYTKRSARALTQTLALMPSVEERHPHKHSIWVLSSPSRQLIARDRLKILRNAMFRLWYNIWGMTRVINKLASSIQTQYIRPTTFFKSLNMRFLGLFLHLVLNLDDLD